MTKTRVTLVLPCFASLFANAINQSDCPETLQKLIKKSRFVQQALTFETVLCRLFYPEIEQSRDLPMAQLRSQGKNNLCVDPCFVYPDQGRLLLFHQAISLSEDDAQQLITHIQPLFAERQLLLQQIQAHQWALHSSELLPDFTALTALEAQPVLQALPSGENAKDWISLWNEVQMSLFDFPLNQQREEQGLLPVNSVWFWGASPLPDVVAHWHWVIGENELLLQLAEQTQTFHQPLNMTEGLSTQWQGNVLVCLPELDWQQDWQVQLDRLEQQIFKPLWKKLRRFGYQHINLIVPDWGEYHITPLQSWKLF